MIKTNKTRSLKVAMLAGVASFAVASAHAQSAGDKAIDFDIDAQDLGAALTEFGVQSGKEVYFVEADVSGKITNGVEGQYTSTRAITLILADAGVPYTLDDNGTVLVGNEYVRTASQTEETTPQPFRVAQLDQEESVREVSGTDEDDDYVQDTIIVTGTNIRGIAPESSPVRSFDRDDILASGAATAQDFIQTLPLNFGGGANENISSRLPNDINAAFNGGASGSLGSSVNLRGLGSGSTLVLLNGRRLAPSSGIGDFIDISLIPASAIERVEVLSDGASAIYGADAVAGVVNFVLRDDYDGVEASFRYGTATEGDFDEYRASFTAGKDWGSGNALVVYEFFDQSSLSALDRDFSQGALVPNDLLPSQERHSVLASVNQELSPDFEVSGDIIYSTREAVQERSSVLSPGAVRVTPSTENLSVSAGASWNVSGSWYLDALGTFSDVHSEPEQGGLFQSKNSIDSTIWTADAKASGGVLELPGGEVKLAIGGHFRTESFRNTLVEESSMPVGDIEADIDRDVYAFFGEAFIPIVGSNNAIPGVERLELNVSGRFEDYSDFGSTIDPKIGLLWAPTESLKLRGSYSTSFNPPPLGRVGASDLLATAFPTGLVNAIFGFTPGDPSIANVVALTLAGTSKDLDPEESRAFTGGIDYDHDWGRHSISVSATYFDIDFDGRLGETPIPGNALSFDAPNIAFNNPELFPEGTIIFFPSAAEVQAVLDSVDITGSIAGADPLDAQIINNAGVLRNLGKTVVTGFDFDIAYTLDSDVGDFTVGLDGTYIKDFQQQASEATPLIDQVDTLFNPVSLNLRTRAGYSRGGFAANIFVNYTDAYKVDNSIGSANIDSWTTVDLSLAYNTGDNRRGAFLNNTTFRLAVTNLFDENPPSVPSFPEFFVFGYDPTNANPRNRFIAFEVNKAF